MSFSVHTAIRAATFLAAVTMPMQVSAQPFERPPSFDIAKVAGFWPSGDNYTITNPVRSDGLLGQVRLRIGDQRLTAVITGDAIHELKLRRGDEAVAIIKSTEVMIAREAELPAEPKRRTASRRRR